MTDGTNLYAFIAEGESSAEILPETIAAKTETFRKACADLGNAHFFDTQWKDGRPNPEAPGDWEIYSAASSPQPK